jgi:hypothetical protein
MNSYIFLVSEDECLDCSLDRTSSEIMEILRAEKIDRMMRSALLSLCFRAALKTNHYFITRLKLI